MATVAILGSAYGEACLGNVLLSKTKISTPLGIVSLYKHPTLEAYALFRHGIPHTYLPNQIPYRAHAWALKEIGCKALLVTSSVGVLDESLPLDRPMIVNDLVMPENRLPDGTACTLWREKDKNQGHLVLGEGLFSKKLSDDLEKLIQNEDYPLVPRVLFAYVQGPRTKTAAENALLAKQGIQVNSMTLGPEVVLANELEIPAAALVIGHKYSLPGKKERLQKAEIKDSLDKSKEIFDKTALAFFKAAPKAEFQNRIYRY